MDKEKKLHALLLLEQRKTDPKLTLKEIERLTGYSKMQLIRLSKELKTKDMDSILTHGNTGRKPAITASDQEVSYLRVMKEPYPSITIRYSVSGIRTYIPRLRNLGQDVYPQADLRRSFSIALRRSRAVVVGRMPWALTSPVAGSIP